MAIIYDISTGAAISPSNCSTPPAAPSPRHSAWTPAARPMIETRTTDPEPPCTAYMALLQQILRDL